MSEHKYYVVWKGRQAGVFETWAETAEQVHGFPGARFKSFATRAEAERALLQAPAEHIAANPQPRGQRARLASVEPPAVPSYAADAACSGNPGVLEYRAVQTESGKVVFARGPFEEGTNNIGEFLAIVELLMHLVKTGDPAPVYSDSRNAIAWVEAKQCKTQLPETERNAKLFKRIARAERWLRTHSYSNLILKWDTEHWGENPADYGRK
jgi:ribonuclease HI